MKTSLHTLKSILIALVLVITGTFISQQSFAQGDIYPSTELSFTGGSSICQNAPAPDLIFSFNTATCGSATFTPIDITVTWFSNTVNATTGGTQVSQQVSTTATTTFNYNPPTATVGTLYYYAEVIWGTGVLNCATTGSLTSSTTQAVTVNSFLPASVSIGASSTTICLGSSVTFTATPANGGPAPTYQWKVNGTNAGTGGPTFTTTTLTNGNTVTVVMTSNAPCVTGSPATSNPIVMTVNPLPSPVVVTPSTATLCQGSIQALSATAAGGPVTASSGTINVNIPDNNAGGGVRTLNISGIPAGAVITGISTTFSINHNNVGDLIVNLKAPNTGVLNLVNKKGNTGNNFVNTTVSSAGVTAFSSGIAPFSATFAPDATNGIGATNNTSNVAAFSALYSVPNGAWVLSARDATFNGVGGTLISCSITISWSYPITWSPITDLYTDAAATIAYSAAQVLSTVYAKPATAGSIVYTATATGANTCTTTGTATLTVNPTPTVSASPTSQTICTGSSISQINITNPNTVAGTVFTWTRTTSASLTGTIPNSGSGSTISGTFNNSSNAAITTTFTITATAGTCSSTTTVTVTVNPIPTISVNTSSQTKCSGTAITSIVISNPNNVAGTTYSWTRDNTTNLTGIAASGTSSTIAGTFTNNTNVQQTTVFTMTASLGTCSTTTTSTVIINPTPSASATPLTQTVCSATAIAQIDITNPNAVPGTTFTWARDNTVNITGLANNGSGVTINGTPANATNVQQTTILTITATSGGCSSTTQVNVKVNPVPAVGVVSNVAICNNANGSAINFTSNVSGATYAWTSTADVGFGTSGNGNIPAYIGANAPVTATVSVTATANGCPGPARTFTVTINPLPSVTIGVDYCTVPGKVRLTANPLPAGSYTYAWSNGATGQVIDVDIAGSYTVTVTNTNGCKATNSTSIAAELAVNGNFEAGNVGFISGYTFNNTANGLQPEGKYAVNTNPNFTHTNFWGTDHTSGTGKMMIVNGAVGPTVWQESVAVVPNTTYYFSAWALSLNNLSPFAQLQFSVNGNTIGVSAVLVAGVTNNAGNNNWQRFYGVWSSGPFTTATCSIVDLQGALGGNDFALDDISISTLSPAAFSVFPSVLGGGSAVCQGDNLNLTANLTGGSSPFTYAWTGPAGFTSSLPNPTIPNTTAANSGTYTLTVTDFYGCVAPSTRVITVTPPPAAPTPVTASPATICLGSNSNLNGTTPSAFQSDFAGFYDIANWSFTNAPTNTGGSINLVGAPASLSITSGNNAAPASPTAGNTDFTITNGSVGGNYSFNWSYVTQDALPSRDIPQYVINGVASNFSTFNTAGSPSQNGTVSVFVPANQSFAIRMRTTTGLTGAATINVTNFSAPVAGSILWYTQVLGGSPIGSSVSAANFSVTPGVTGMSSYYAEATSSNGCSGTARTQVDVNVNQPSAAPTGLSASPNPICAGSSVTLTQTGGTLGTGATWKWYSNSTYTTFVGNGTGANASLTVSPIGATTYYLRAEGTTSPCTANVAGPVAGVTVTVRTPSVAPTTLNASVNPICRGNSTTLTQTGGTLGTGASWKWYSDAGYTTFVGNGTGANASLTVNPLVTTTYYLRAEGTTSPCTANVTGPSSGITVTVNQPSVAATGLNASPNIFCGTGNATLTQTGGTLGTGASWKWYSDNTYATFVGTGSGANASLVVSPIGSTTYYLRAEGATSPCTANAAGPVAGVTVTVNQPSVAPTSLNVSVSPICNGNSTTLTQTGGTLGTGASWKWYSDNTYTTFVGTGTGANATLSVSPLTTTTYYLRIEGTLSPCTANVAGPAGVTVTVNQKSGNPTSASTSPLSICAGSSAVLSLNGGGGVAGETIVWYTGSCGGTIAGTGNNLSVSPLVTTTYYGRYENGAPCNYASLCSQVTVNVTTTGTWLGFNTNWHNPINWCGGVPTSSTNVTIPFMVSGIYPVVSLSDAMANDITCAAGASLQVTGQTLAVYGNINNNGNNLDITNGTIEFTGNLSSQDITGTMFAGNTIKDLRISNTNGVNIIGTDTLKLSGVLKFGVSNAVFNTNNHLTLLSSATGTASVGDMTNNGTVSGNQIIGNVTVERFIPNHFKAWQFMAVPTKGQTVNAAWQEGNTPLSNSTHPGYGTIITSNIPGAVGLGFDVYTPAGPTMKTYNPATGAWVGIPDPSMQIANQQGYMLFVRGDRSVTTSGAPATNTILRTTGTLYTSGVDAPPTTNVLGGTFESVANPYASAIDFTNITKTGGIQEVFYVWDPKLTTTGISAYGLGAYQTFFGPGPNFTIIPGGGSYTNNNTNIESGQAFFVHAPFFDGSVSFTETAKVDGSNLVTRPTGNNVKQLRNNLYVITNGNPILLDGTLSRFDAAYSNDIDIMDAVKLANSSENLALVRNGQKLVAESRAEVQTSDTLFYNLGLTRIQQYQFEFIPTEMYEPGLVAFLEDSYLNTSTVVDLRDTTRVLFNIVNIPGSYAADRFHLVFKQLVPTPVTFTSITASRNADKSISVNWKVQNETSIQKYTVERSEDGRNFSGIITADPLVNNGGEATYARNDLSPLAKDNFYRIRALSINGRVEYSNVVRVAALKSTPSITIYPNPVTGKTIQLQFVDQPVGKYNIVLMYSNGMRQQLSTVDISSSQSTQPVALPQLLAAGIYRLQITAPDGTTTLKTINVATE